MKKLALIAILLSAPAFAQEPPKPAEAAADAASAQPAASPPPETKPAPAPPAVPATPTVWAWTDMDAGDLNNLNTCAQELPKKVADQWILRLSQHIKGVK